MTAPSSAEGLAYRIRQLAASITEELALAVTEETPQATFEGLRAAHDALLTARRALEQLRESSRG